ncbi:MAG: NAD(P)/FAD-dependent oxidoreductase [Planctomycetota bacterium]|nr:NAD(P)/FAD-dependent oxidoreductase [Planctomycetota bacterium]
MTADRYDALVIGAGMSGLAAGIRLAQFGRRVAILERHALWGGLNSFYKRGGRRFDSGLHALTNFARPESKTAPLSRVLRQLRLRFDDLHLGEQGRSRLHLADVRLDFSNDFALLEAEVARAFPAQRTQFASFVRAVREAEPFTTVDPSASGRAFLREHLTDEDLVEALMLPLCWYGSAREGDVDAYQAIILFRAIFLEGLARPRGGIKPLLDLLVARYKAEGGELRTHHGVESVLRDSRGAARGVRLDSGDELLSDRILSSAGYVETRNLCGESSAPADQGRLSFVETQRVLSQPSASIGALHTLVFFSDSLRPAWRRPEEPVDLSNGVIACSDNYAGNEIAPRGLMRVTCLANPETWCAYDEAEYRTQKDRWEDAICAAAAPYAADPRPLTTQVDCFTPRTITHYTGHTGGTVYGSPRKRLDGDSGVPNVHLIGTDQGFVGIVGALMSGISIANRHALVAQ